jgi:uncharacterized membrane protein
MTGVAAEETAVDESEASTGLARHEKVIAALIVLLSIAGIGVSSYLTYVHWLDKSVVCVVTSGCNEVAQSKYARLFGVPVAFVGLLGYVALLATAVFWLLSGHRWDNWPLMAAWGMALGGVAFSAYLTYVELFVIDAVCIWCVISAVIIVGMLIVTTVGLLLSEREQDEIDFDSA